MAKRRIYLAADSAGYFLKEEVKSHLLDFGYKITDFGTDSAVSCHYPIFASKVAEAVQKKPDTSFGILICGTGIGMSMCANKYNGIRAAVCSDTYSAKMTRRHNDANVLCMGARVIGTDLALDIVDTFLENKFDGDRHILRLEMMAEIEKKQKSKS